MENVRTLAHLRETKFDYFRNLGLNTADFLAQLNAVEYIEETAGTLDLDLGETDIIDTFLSREGKILVGKREINAKLKPLLATHAAKKSLGEDFQREVAKAAAKFRARKQDHAQELKRAYERHLESVRTTNERLKAQHLAARRAYIDMLSIGKQDDAPMAKELAEIQAAGFFNLVPSDDRYPDHIFFGTAHPIILAYRNPDAGVDLRVNLGHMQARLSLSEMYLTVKAHTPLLVPGGIYHPYVSSTGNICWGNASQTASEYLVSGQIAKALALLQSLLTTYDPSTTPYAALEVFQEAQNELEPEELRRIAEPIGGLRETCDHPDDNCQCASCDVCDTPFYGDPNCDCCHGCNRQECRCITEAF